MMKSKSQRMRVAGRITAPRKGYGKLKFEKWCSPKGHSKLTRYGETRNSKNTHISANKRIKARLYCAAELAAIRSAEQGAVWPALCVTLGNTRQEHLEVRNGRTRS
jgi:hypothetical protein